ncbi:MAG: glycosyltransferase [Bdellovibrionales bacterium]|nr:glycosyltransferase [Bdellovibrionales bacterium]
MKKESEAFRGEVKVSVLVSTYNAESYMAGCLEDLVKQSLFSSGKAEILVVDCASPEREGDIVRSFQGKYRNISYVRLSERETLYGAWNVGVQYALGSYLTNANTDDRHHPEFLATMMNVLEANPAADLAYANVFRSTKENELFDQNDRSITYRYKPYFAPDCLLHYQFGCQPMWRRSLHNTLGFFERQLRAAGDYEFNLRFALEGKRAVHVDEVLGSFLERPTSLSQSDSTSVAEQGVLRRKYIHSENILKLYQHEGFDIHGPWERAAVFHQMSLRALQFEMPWHPGQTFSDPEVAICAISSALEIYNGHPTLLNNLAVVLHAVGQLEDARSILSQIREHEDNEVISRNRARCERNIPPRSQLEPCRTFAPAH